jgi:hypothetical protein
MRFVRVVGHKSQSHLGLHYLGLLVLFTFEAATFYWVVADQIAPFYPPYFDQTSYYFGVYELIERIRFNGWIELLHEFAPPKHAFGATFLVQGALLALIGGNTRTSILTLNLVYFLAAEFAMFETIRRKTGDIAMAWLAIGLLLPLPIIFSTVGGIYDFRVDFSAFCFYGIWACAVLWSDSFRSLARSAAVATVAILLISLRFLTAVYVALTFVGFFLAFAIGMWRGATAFRRSIAARRLRNVVTTGILTAVVVIPLLIAARDIIYFYYVIGHVLTNEKYIRAEEQGLYTLLDHIHYYPRIICSQLIGKSSFVLWGGAAMMAVIGAIWLGRMRLRDWIARFRQFRSDFLALALMIIVPVVILTIDIAKSPIVGGIVIIPLLMTVVLCCAALWPHRLHPSPAADVAAEGQTTFGRLSTRLRLVSARSLKPAFCAGLLAVALVGFTRHGIAPQHYLVRSDLENVAILNKAIARYAIENSLAEPKLSFDRVVDYLALPTIRLASYESFGKIVSYIGRMGHGDNGIFATPREVALRLIADSDVIVLTDPVRGRETPYPINGKIREYWDDMHIWTLQNCRLLVAADVLGIPHRVYVCPRPGRAVPGQ